MQEPLARYPVRTPAWVWGAFALTALATATLAWRAGLLLAPGLPLSLALLALLSLPMVLVVWSSRPYRVGGASVEVYADRVEIPRPFRGHLAFPLDALRVSRLRVIQSLTVMHLPTGVQLDRGELVTFLAPGMPSRRLSDRVFIEPGSLSQLLADLTAASKGEPARGPEGWTKLFRELDAVVRAQTPIDPRDAELDAELRR